MKIRSTSSLSHALKPRPIINAASACALIGVACVMMLMHQNDSEFVVSSKATLQDALTPVITVLSTPAKAMTSFGNKIEDISLIYAENNGLKEENAQLLKWQAVAYQLEKENTELRTLLGLSKPPQSRYVTARIVNDNHDLKSHTLLLRHNDPDSLKSGYAVMTSAGVIGRVIQVSQNAARVLLVTDSQSRLPVKHESNNQEAILSGTNDGKLFLKYVKNPEDFKIGDRIVTGDNAQYIPTNIAIGEVSSVRGNIVMVEAYADIDTLNFVSIAVPSRDTRPLHAPMPQLPRE